MQMIQYEVNVEKAVDLKKGESLNEFTEKLRDSGSKFVNQKMNMNKDDYAYIAEVFQSSVVFSVYKAATSSGKSGYGYFAATYKRDDNGNFTFDTLTEVVRKTVWEPKTVATTKAADETAQVTTEAPADVAKGLWNGVL